MLILIINLIYKYNVSINTLSRSIILFLFGFFSLVCLCLFAFNYNNDKICKMVQITKITVKELAQKMAVSSSSATALLQDIKKEYGIKIVTMSHVIHYLKIPHPLNI